MAALGFAAACDVLPGDDVLHGGAWRRVKAVRHSGRDWPYYQLDGPCLTPFELGGPDWVSWQVCGATQRPCPLAPVRPVVVT